MPTSRVRTALLAAVAAGLALSAPPALAQEPPSDFTEVVQELSPTVVAITARRLVEQDDPTPDGMPFPFPSPDGGPPGQPGQPDEPRQARALGSGFLISGEGHIVTNNHVIQNATEIEVLLEDGTTRTAEIVGTDPATDLAVLQIEATDGMTVATWGDSETMEPGAWTIAIGSPFGLGGTVTVGVLSARSRDIRVGPYDDYLQTDASINRGNSGGPLFNVDGEVIGVNTAIFSPVGVNVGIGFAVPSQTARPVVEQLIATGEVRRGFIGVRLQAITEAMARALGLDETQGALVAEVEEDAPAEAAGIRRGDVILAVDGQMVDDARDLSFNIAERDPGETVTLTIVRDEERIDVEITLGQRDAEEVAAAQPDPEPTPETDARLGIAVAPLPGLIRRELGIDEGGLIVQRVEAGGLGAEAGLEEGDVLVEAGGEPITEPRDLVEAWQEAQDRDRPLLLRVVRDERSLFFALEG